MPRLLSADQHAAKQPAVCPDNYGGAWAQGSGVGVDVAAARGPALDGQAVQRLVLRRCRMRAAVIAAGNCTFDGTAPGHNAQSEVCWWTVHSRTPTATATAMRAAMATNDRMRMGRLMGQPSSVNARVSMVAKFAAVVRSIH